MTPPGQNYPIHEHGFLFWGIYLGVIVTMTVLLLGLFLLMVQRNSQATRAAQAASTTPSGSLDATGTTEITEEAGQVDAVAPVASAKEHVTVVGGPHAA